MSRVESDYSYDHILTLTLNMILERFTLDTYDRKSQVNPISSSAMVGVNTKISNRTMKNINEFNKRLSASRLSTLEGRIDEISETGIYEPLGPKFSLWSWSSPRTD